MRYSEINKISIKVWCTSISITIISLIQLNVRVDLWMNAWITDGVASTKILIDEYQTKMQGWSVLTNLLLVVESVTGTGYMRDTRITLFFLVWFSLKMCSSQSIQTFYSLIIHCDCNYFDLTCHICRYIFDGIWNFVNSTFKFYMYDVNE